MQQDDKLKELLQQFAIEDTSADFTQNIMQWIEANTAPKQAAEPLVNIKYLRVLAGVFLAALGVLLVLVFKDRFAVISIPSTLTLNANYISQLTWFIIVFWVVMLINIFWQQKQTNLTTSNA